MADHLNNAFETAIVHRKTTSWFKKVIRKQEDTRSQFRTLLLILSLEQCLAEKEPKGYSPELSADSSAREERQSSN